MSRPPTAGVRIRGLRKRYGDTIALDGLDLDARAGEILGVAGPNGAGKSTMVKILAGRGRLGRGRDPRRRRAVVERHRLAPRRGRAPGAAALPEPDRRREHRRRPRSGAALAEDGRRPPRELFEELGSSTLRDTPLGDARPRDPAAHRDHARARARRAGVLFDEPNSALTPEESAEFFRLMPPARGRRPRRDAHLPPADRARRELRPGRRDRRRARRPHARRR